MKGASFARRYFFLIGACLLKMQKIDSLNRPKCVSFKEQKLCYFRSKGITVTIFVFPISNNMGFASLETYFKFSNCE